MTNREGIEILKSSLTNHIQRWIDRFEAEEESWLSLDTLVGDQTAQLMAKAAITVLEAQADLSEHIRQQMTTS